MTSKNVHPMKTAMLSWNPFQLLQFKNIIPYFESIVVFIVDRGGNRHLFKKDFLDSLGAQVQFIKTKQVALIDLQFDVVLFQSPFPHIEKFSHAKLVCLQYGLAKERHNYGEWRSLADLNLMYGEYSAQFTEHFTPSFSVGNPRFDSLENYSADDITAFKNKLALDKHKPTLLYLPTWGQLGSFGRLIEELGRLKDKYNIIIKMHHNNDQRLANWAQTAKSVGIRWNFEGDIDSLTLLLASDVVVSDFSGAIFDALYVEKPIVLYQEGASSLQGVQKFDYNSLEYARRDEIGYVCESQNTFETTVDHALEMGTNPKLFPLKQELFADTATKAGQRIYSLICKLHQGELPALSRVQKWVREVTISERNLQRQKNHRTLNIKKWLARWLKR